jgi:primosomal protein N' (replication factor Y)
VALLTLKGRSEDKVKFSAEHLKRELEKTKANLKGLIIAGPAPAPLVRAENLYRYQIMLRTRAMTKLSQSLATIVADLTLPDDVTMTVDIDPVNLS